MSFSKYLDSNLFLWFLKRKSSESVSLIIPSEYSMSKTVLSAKVKAVWFYCVSSDATSLHGCLLERLFFILFSPHSGFDRMHFDSL